MNHPDEKKWFVYITDHHEGPFSLIEVQEKLIGGVISEQNYVWADGMADWVPFTSVPELGKLVKVPPSQPTFGTFSSDKNEDTSTTLTIQPVALDSVVVDQIVEPEPTHTITQEFSSEPTRTLDQIQPLKDSSLEEPETLEPQMLEPMSFEPQLEEAHLEEPKLVEPALGESTPSPTPEIAQSSESTAPFELAESKSDGVTSKVSTEDEIVTPEKKKISKSIIIAAVLVLAAGGLFLSRGVLSPAVSALKGTFAPYLGRWISPIPKLEDVDAEEYDQLKEAAISSSSPSGPKVAIAFSKENALTPKFYVSADVIDGTTYEVSLEANGDTLLNQFSYSAKTSVLIKTKFGVTEPIKTQTGLVVPRGDYTVSVVDVASKKVLARKNYFLGGPRDAAYLERLSDFHERVKRKAQDELTELSQFVDNLASQFERTQSRFSSNKSNQGKKTKLKTWTEQSKDWKKFQSQFEAGVQKWTPENLENDLFYGVIYKLVPAALQSVSKLHQVQDQYLLASENLPALEAEVVQFTTDAQSAIDGLKKKVEQAKALPPSGKGMPRRDGL